MAAIILKQLITFAIMAAIGVVAVKLRVLDSQGLGAIASLVINITMPLMLLTNILEGATRQQLLDTLIIIPLGILLVALLYALSWLTAKLCRLEGNKKRVFCACGTLGNNGFMGIPLAVALFPQLGTLYSAVFTLVDQTACWSLGYYLCLPEEKLKDSKWSANLKKVVNPCIVAICIAVVMLLAGLHLPDLLQSALSTVGGVTSPLAMVYIGGLAAGLDLNQALTTREFYLIPVVKMLLTPLLMFLVLHTAGVDEGITLYMTMIAGTPTMASVAMMARNNGSEGDYAAGAVLLTTVCCIVTLPLVMLVVGLV
ncbi:MAG: AEC family transporter [Clostridiales bacterium]|nr:AEC family transporter [Clostridiales bacterium]